MSTALGIAAVTHVLKDLLNDGLINNNVSAAVNSVVTVSSLPPGQIEATTGVTPTQLNIFMYRVSSNVGWINTGYPSRNGRGDIINNPPLALDLHYLMTAFGESELHAEVLLGYGMQILHENPVLTRGAIRNSINSTIVPDPDPRLTGIDLALSTSELAEQIEQIKITNENINTEEMSRLWTAFQTRYRPCTAYKTTVVLIESNKSTITPLPVQNRVFYTIPFKQPVIEKILSQIGPITAPKLANQRITVEHRIVIQGKQLKKEDLQVLIGGEAFLPDTNNIRDDEIILEVPDTLRAGILGVQVSHPILMGIPLEPRRGPESNLHSFVLSPIVTNPTEVALVDNGIGVEMDVNPGLYRGQRVLLLLNELNPPLGEEPQSYSFHLPSNALASEEIAQSSITFPIQDVQTGDYLVRIQVDGAESPLLTDIDGIYENPQVNIS